MSTIRSIDPLDESGAGSAMTSEEDAGLGSAQDRARMSAAGGAGCPRRLAGLTSHVTMRQTFRNSLDKPIEATYIFPLPRSGGSHVVLPASCRSGDRRIAERTRAGPS